MHFNALLAQRYNKALRSLLGLEEQEGVGSVAPEIMPVVVAEDDRPENYFLKGELLCMGFGAISGVAGNRSCHTLRNRSNSGVLVTIDRVEPTSISDLTYQSLKRWDELLTPDGSSIEGNSNINKSIADTRAQNSVPTLDGRSTVATLAQINAGAGTQISNVPLTLGRTGIFSGYWNGPVILKPGSGLLIFGATDNMGTTVNFWWRERPVRPSELVA